MNTDLILQYWLKLNSFGDVGRWLFSKLLGRFVPYTGSIPFKVEELSPGKCVVLLEDKSSVRNHLKSIHAMALANLGEVVSGLALNCKLPEGCQAILTHFQISYIKKARGLLRAESTFVSPKTTETQDYVLPVVIKNPDGAIVAEVQATWRVGLKKTGAKN